MKRKWRINYDYEKTNKKILGVTVIASMMFSAMPVVNASAATGYHYHSMTAKCSCGEINISYGVMRDYQGTSQTFHEGQYCEGCERIVPSGEFHYYFVTQDRFSFKCSRCGRNYSALSLPIPAEHTVTNN